MHHTLKQALVAQLSEVLASLELSVPTETIKLERPIAAGHGDWSTNIALVLSGQIKTNPRVLAAQMATALEASGEVIEIVDKIEVAGPGFINFHLKPSYYQKILTSETILPQVEVPQRIMLEFGQPNTHKLPHIGHLFSYIAGDSISNILAAVGHTVRKVNYQGDVGPHVAKCLYGWYKLGKQEPEDLLTRVRHLQECYQLGATAYEEDPQIKEEINKINKAIYENDASIQADWEKTRQWSLDYYLAFEQRLGVEQKEHYLESQVWRKGMEIVRQHIGTVFIESDGAIVFPGENFGLHTRVFITKNNTPTYEAKDVGLNKTKLEDWPFDLDIITTASEQNGYFNVVIAAINEALPELRGKMKHIGFGMISLSSGKMSSRTGKIVSGPDLLETVKERVTEIVGGREGLSAEKKEEIAETVALGAIKYAFLKGNILQNMTFNLEESIAFEGNSGPYLQYTYARIKSIIAKAGEIESEISPQVLEQTEEIELLKWLERMPETVAAAAETYSPHLIATYLFELAQRFNSFYKTHSINKAESEEIKQARLALAAKVAEQLRTGLGLLGIATVEKM